MRNTLPFLGLSAAALLLIGCNQATQGDAFYEGEPAPQMGIASDSAYAEAGIAQAPDLAPPGEPSANDNPIAQSYLAYRYSYSFSLPYPAVKPTMEAQRQRCFEAGPTRCQVLGSSSNSYAEDGVNADLYIRAEPNWLTGFVDAAKAEVGAVDGALDNASMSSEDLTRQILDTDARLKAQTALRDRLQGLLETRNAELKDLLDLERELARVQGQIESATTTLNVLRKRVSMSEVNLSYRTKQSAVSSSALQPVGRAFSRFVGTVSSGLAGVIDFIAFMLPWLIFVILPGLWLLRWFLRRRAARKTVMARTAP